MLAATSAWVLAVLRWLAPLAIDSGHLSEHAK